MKPLIEFFVGKIAFTFKEQYTMNKTFVSFLYDKLELKKY